jgi:hypothetical protein
MTQLKDALQFVCLALIARLIGYLFVRIIEFFKPRSIHFIIAPETAPDNQGSRHKTPPFMDQFKPKRKHSAKQGKNAFYLREWGRMLKLRISIVLFAAESRFRNRYGRKRSKISVKLVTEIVGLLTAVVSLAIMLFDYFLK